MIKYSSFYYVTNYQANENGLWSIELEKGDCQCPVDERENAIKSRLIRERKNSERIDIRRNKQLTQY